MIEEKKKTVRKKKAALSSASLVKQVVDALVSNPSNLFEQSSLGMLAEALGADRAYLVSVHGDANGLTTMKVRNRWIQHQKQTSYDYDSPYFDGTMETAGGLAWKRKLEDGNAFLSDFRDATPSIRRLLESRAAQSVLLVPIRVSGEWWGFLEFIDCTALHRWNGRLLVFLQSIAGVIGMALQNEVMREFIEKREIQALESAVITTSASEKINAVRKWRDSLTSAFAHEFRTPLYTLLGFSATLLENQDLDDDPEIRRMCLTHIYEQARRLESLVQNILTTADFSADSSEQGRLLDITTVAARAIEEIRERVRPEGIDIYFTAPESPVELVGQPEAVSRLLGILLNYCVTRVSTNGWVSLSLARGPHAVEMIISDNGTSLSAQDAARLFDIATMPSALSGYSGGNLGLSIAKDIVDSLHGFVTVESRDGEGISFRCSFPIDTALH
ncbi:MAG: GAF domain-containing sensor histidine kinase [Ignavibacteriae bacterium]|nr:GAF domain-containing sensor histidine kinase [Ignavibacteriota bacterium]